MASCRMTKSWSSRNNPRALGDLAAAQWMSINHAAINFSLRHKAVTSSIIAHEPSPSWMTALLPLNRLRSQIPSSTVIVAIAPMTR